MPRIMSSDNSRFQLIHAKVNHASNELAKTLEHCRRPVAAADCPHAYDDKFTLAEYVVGSGAEAVLVGLHNVGLTGSALTTAREAATTKMVCIELRHSASCIFKRKVTKKRDGVNIQSEVSGLAGTFKRIVGAVTTVDVYEWDYTTTWQVCATPGTDAPQVLSEGTTHSLLVTANKTPPYPEREAEKVISADITWLLRCLDVGLHPVFVVDRDDPACTTPRRNRDVEEALSCVVAVGCWGEEVAAHFRAVFGAEPGNDLGMCFNTETVSPAVPVLLEVGEDNADTPSAVDREALVLAAKRKLLEGLSTVNSSYKTVGGVPAGAAAVAHVASYLVVMRDSIEDGVDYLELLLREHLVAAVGKVVTSTDFAEYMQYHCRRVFVESAAPTAFCRSVRVPGHDPEGVVEITRKGVIPTISRKLEGRTKFALDAATEVHFTGPQYIHAHCTHRFSTEELGDTTLRCRARQFGGYVVVLGVVTGKDSIVPKHAVYVRNKDDLSIPLILEEIPSAKEFRKAVESLSPEQRRFAQAYRSMQMEATLFAICLIQIKPQVEAVLNLPENSLTKEIELATRLSELFTKYHIASDLLAYKGPAECSVKDKVEYVRSKAEAVFGIIKKKKAEALAEEQRIKQEAAAAAEMQRRLDVAWRSERLERSSVVNCSAPMSGAVFMKQAKSMKKSRGFGFSLPSMPSLPKLRRDDADDEKWSKSFECDAFDGGAYDDEPSPDLPLPIMEKAEEHNEDEHDGREEDIADNDIAEGEGGEGDEDEAAKDTPKGTLQTVDTEDEDMSALPDLLEKRYAEIEDIACLRPTTISVGAQWTRERREGLLGRGVRETLKAAGLESERSAAFRLLTSLTKGGEVPLARAELHVVTVATHCFDETLMDTVVKANVNPIERVEASMLLTASTILGRPVKDLVKQAHSLPSAIRMRGA